MKKTLLALLTSCLSAVSSTTFADCTLICAAGDATASGEALIASTSDNPYLAGPRKPVKLTIPQKGYKFVHTPCLEKQKDGTIVDLGSDRGMNETGFSWTRSWVVPIEQEDPDKIDAQEWFARLGATVATVDEAIDFVKNTPKGMGCQGNYIFADAEGNAAIVEVSFKTVSVAEYFTADHGGVGARANRFETAKMRKIDDSAAKNAVYYNTSEYRYSAAMKLLKEDDGSLDIASLQKILAFRDPSVIDASQPHEMSISNHGKECGTVSAEIYDPKNTTFYYTYGWPDGNAGSADRDTVGFNINSWGIWLPFDLKKMTESGFYTDWEGNLTPLGIRYLKAQEQ